MSFQVVKWVLDCCSIRGASARLLLVALAEHADDAGTCYPGVDALARRMKLTPRQCQSIIRKLEEAKELRIVAGGKGPKNTNRYILVMGRDQETVAKLAAAVELEARGKGEAGYTHKAGLQGRKGEAQRSKGEAERCGRVKPSAPKGEAGNTRTIREPALEPSRTISAGAGRESSRPHEGRRGGTAALDSVFKGTRGAGTAGGNGKPVQLEIVQLMGDRGCDASFRQTVAKLADVRTVRRVAAEYDQRSKPPDTPGGWWRIRLRGEGVEGI